MLLDNPRHEQFAQRIAGGASATAAYVAAGYASNGAAQSARRLLQNAQIKARLQELRNAIAAAMTQHSVNELSTRIGWLQERIDKMRVVIAERSAAKENQKVAGGSTGLLVRTVKMLGSGIYAKAVDEFAVDTGLLRELREHEMQASRELGQYAEKHEHSGPGGGPIAVTALSNLSDEELDGLAGTLRKLANTAGSVGGADAQIPQ